ncbi:MAG TPA: peroxiredoxin [Steroidobacteraceae bacterium]|jgi:peroxiredoxin Q/BCP
MYRIRNVRYLALGAVLWLGLVHAQTPPPLGSVAPDFRLQDQNGKWQELKDYRGKWVALYFYPKDQTPGCTTQACEFRDNVFAFRDAGAVILGVSVDNVESHQKFAAKNSLPFPILADSSKAVTKKYGVLKSYMGVLELARRDTFLIDPQGHVVKHYADVDPEGHSAVVLNDLKAMQKKETG